jgi:hypothetical protein
VRAPQELVEPTIVSNLMVARAHGGLELAELGTRMMEGGPRSRSVSSLVGLG